MIVNIYEKGKEDYLVARWGKCCPTKQRINFNPPSYDQRGLRHLHHQIYIHFILLLTIIRFLKFRKHFAWCFPQTVISHECIPKTYAKLSTSHDNSMTIRVRFK